MTRPLTRIIFLTLALASSFGMAGSIDPNTTPTLLEAHGLRVQGEQPISETLFTFLPFAANSEKVVPGFADPLGTGVDPALRVFKGKVHFMDLLGDFKTEDSDQTAEIAMPRGTLRATELLSSLISRYLAKSRAYDQSMFNVGTAEVTERDGVPVTSESIPLSLAGFGTVINNQKPTFLHWTKCPARTKREESMNNAKAKRRWECSAPGVCFCSSI